MSTSPNASACHPLPVCAVLSAWSAKDISKPIAPCSGGDRIGLGLTVFVGIKIEGHANARADPFEKAIRAMPEVVACHMVSGEADYLLEVVVPDLQHYQRFLLGKLLDLPIVKEVRSNIAIQSVKTAAALPLDHLNPPKEPRKSPNPAVARKLLRKGR